MSITKKPQELRRIILKTVTQIEQIKRSGLLEYSDSANVRYNKLLIEKAMYEEELRISKMPLIQKLWNKFAGTQNKGEKLICDYFKC